MDLWKNARDVWNVEKAKIGGKTHQVETELRRFPSFQRMEILFEVDNREHDGLLAKKDWIDTVMGLLLDEKTNQYQVDDNLSDICRTLVRVSEVIDSLPLKKVGSELTEAKKFSSNSMKNNNTTITNVFSTSLTSSASSTFSGGSVQNNNGTVTNVFGSSKGSTKRSDSTTVYSNGQVQYNGPNGKVNTYHLQ